MRTLSIQGLPDKRRQKVLVHDWPEPEGPTGNEVKTETIYSGINKRYRTESTDWRKLRSQR